MTNLESACVTDVGLKRKRNEDVCHVDEPLGLYLVADGMGGHNAGQTAARLVSVATTQRLRRAVHDKETPAGPNGLSVEAKRLVLALRTANRVVFENARKHKALHGMGSTAAAVRFVDNRVIAANVGDSPIYLARGDNIRLLSTPHTVEAEAKALAAEMGVDFGHPGYKHVVTRAMGLEYDVKPDCIEMPIFQGDRVILCSDGLSDKASEEEIAAVTLAEAPEKACQTLLRLALDRGGDDNVTIVVIRVMDRGFDDRASRLFMSMTR